MIYVFTGNGKGKTTAAIGTAVRALGNKEKVLIVQFLKDKSVTSETVILEKLKGCRIESFGRRGFYLPKDMLDKNPDLRKLSVKPLEKIDRDIAYRGLEFVRENAKHYDLIILDEICVAIFFNLLDVKDIIDVIKHNISKDFIITGRNCPKDIIDISDLTTEMVEIKHPYQKGIKAKKGLDF